MRYIRCEAICSLVWGTKIQRAVCRAVEYRNSIFHTYDPVPTWCTRIFKYGASGVFDILNATLSRFLILFVGFRLFSAYSIGAKKIAHIPHKLFLCIVVLDVNRNATLVEAVLKYFVNVQD